MSLTRSPIRLTHHASRITHLPQRITPLRPRLTPLAWALPTLLLISALARGAETNLIRNGGFEAASTKDATRPAGWTPHVHGKVSCAWAEAEGRDGSRCLKMTAEPGEKSGHAYWTSDPIALKPCVAYRVRFHFKAEGHGVPCFSLAKVKEWRLFKGGTEGRWLVHDEAIVAPPKVTETRFFVNNYHRPGKTMWLDDVSLVELPLAESPLTRRLAKATRTMAALGRSLKPFRLGLEQETALDGLRRSLADASAAYARLEGGDGTTDDFQRAAEALDAIEAAVGAWLFTVWPVSSEDWARGRIRPREVTRSIELPADPAKGPCTVGLMALVGEALPLRVAIGRDRAARDWRVRVLTTPAGARGRAWGELNPLGEILLPSGAPRFLRIEVDAGPSKATAGTVTLTLEALDRRAEGGTILLRCSIAAR